MSNEETNNINNDNKLDDYAEKINKAVSDGISKLEAAFDKGHEDLKAEMQSDRFQQLRQSPRMGLILLVGGVVWLLLVTDVINKPIFPILLIGFGVYLLVRNR